ncbi:MAG: hypothetical protein JJE34_07545 [Alphaproteobacteria bacterium]|nr:hypothetical protein [Alphaproteobacteria bacterium]
MNFPHRLEGLTANPISFLGDGTPDLSILLAVASAQQATCPTARFIAAEAGQTLADVDFVGTLTQVFAPHSWDNIKAANLTGCFNPLIAGNLMVGQKS